MKLDYLKNMDAESWVNLAIIGLILLTLFMCRFSCEVKVSTTAAI